MPHTTTAKLHISGMTCQSCVKSVENALKSIQGVHPDSVKVDLLAATATLALDCDAVHRDIVADTLENTGYDMESWELVEGNEVESSGPATLSSDISPATFAYNDTLDQIIVTDGNEAQQKATVLISGMTCASCVDTIERVLKKLPGVQPDSVTVNLLMGNGTLVFGGNTINDKYLKDTIENLGYEVDGVHIIDMHASRTLNGVTTNILQFRDMIVSGMFCQGCVGKLEKVLTALEGVDKRTVSVSLEHGAASFVYQGDSISRTVIEKNLGFIADTIEIVEEQPSTIKSEDSSSSPFSTDRSLAGDLTTTRLSITGMTCASCVNTIERILLNCSGVYKAQVNLVTNSALVLHDSLVIGTREIVEAVNEVGYEAQMIQDTSVQDQRDTMRDRMHREETKLRNYFLWSLLFAVPVLLISMIFMLALSVSNPVRQVFEAEITHGLSVGDLVLFLLATPVQFWLGWPFYRKAYRSLIYSHTANMEVLVSMGITVAYVSSIGSIIAAMAQANKSVAAMEFFDTSVFLVTFIHLGKWLEALAKGKTAETITKLMDLQPEEAVLVKVSKDKDGNETMEEKELETSAIQVGDILKVNPGGRIPCDGKLWRGTTLIDESMITGESIPVTKSSATQDPVIGATINVTSTIYIRALHVGADTTLSRIIQLVQDAQASPKAPIAVLADKISAVFVPIVVLIATITFVVWLLCGLTGVYPNDWVPYGENKGLFSLMFAVTVLVIACPCGLGLASPTAIMVGTGVAARYGILIKGGGYALEMANRINTIVFDKTGTLTVGKPVVTDSWLLNEKDEAEPEAADILWKILSQVTLSSNHPLSKAVAQKAQAVLKTSFEKPENSDEASVSEKISLEEIISGVKLVHSFETPGRGVTATIRLSRSSPLHIPDFGDLCAFTVYLGNQAWMEENNARYPPSIDADNLKSRINQWQEAGSSIVMVAVSPIGPLQENRSTTSLGETSQEPADHGHDCKHECECECEFCARTCNCHSRDAFSNAIIVAQIAVADVPRPEAQAVIAGLKVLGMDVWMLTGDNVVTARAVARQLGMDSENVLAEVKPEQKAEKIKSLQKKGVAVPVKRWKIWGHQGSSPGAVERNRAIVAMVGDGINDSPALAQSDVGISVGSATDVAIEAASIILIRNSLTDLLTLHHLSHAIVQRVRVNFVWAFVYNIIAIPIAAGVLFPATKQGLPPMVAGLAMIVSSISVVCSSLMLRRYRPPEHIE